MNPDRPTWYRHIPTGTPPPVRRAAWVRPVLFWTLSIVFAVGFACVVPFGFLLVLPFMIGFIATVRGPRDNGNTRTNPRHPYDDI